MRNDDSALLLQKADNEKKQALLAAFRDRFLLKSNEIAALTLASEPIDDNFFAALAKAKRIMKDCEILLGFESQVLGQGLMEQVSKDANAAYQRLYRWTQREFKTLNIENPQVNSSIRRALRVLAERPSLFQGCLASFAEARERILSDSFFLALTGTSPDGAEDPTVKPIDMAAHDPLRYVGDMLAWTHSATVGDREALEALFISEGDEITKGLETGKEAELWHLAAEDDGDGGTFDFKPLEVLNELVDRNVSGVVRLLRQRIEQVIQTNEDTVTAYKLANLLGFYQTMFSKLLGSRSSLLDALAGTEAEAIRQFRFLIRDRIAVLKGELHQLPGDLRPPSFFLDSLRQLALIMRTYDTSAFDVADRGIGFQPLLDDAFEPFMTMCEDMKATLRGSASSIFILNCYLAAMTTFDGHDFTQQGTHRLQAAMSNETQQLVEIHYTAFCQNSGLDNIFNAMRNADSNHDDVSGIWSSFDPEALARASNMLDDFLPSALMDATENLKPIQDPSLVKDIIEQAAARFCDDYARMESYLGTVEHRGDEAQTGELLNLRELFPRTTGEVRVLLS